MAEKDNVEELNDACELLMEHSACSRVRDQTVDTQANYTKLLTSAQGRFKWNIPKVNVEVFIHSIFCPTSGLVAKIEKNLSDHTEFLNYKNEMDAWIEKAQHILDGCNGEGDIQQIVQQIDTVNVSLPLPLAK